MAFEDRQGERKTVVVERVLFQPEADQRGATRRAAPGGRETPRPEESGTTTEQSTPADIVPFNRRPPSVDDNGWDPGPNNAA